MVANVEQDDFLFGYQDGERDAVLMGNLTVFIPFSVPLRR